jgi:hypothetical protein
MATEMRQSMNANGKYEPKLYARRFSVRHGWYLALLILFLPLSQRILHAQVDTGSIVGTVLDSSGVSPP